MLGARAQPRLGTRLVPSDVVARLVARAGEQSRSGTWWGTRLGHLTRYRLAKNWGVYIHPSARVGRVRFPHPTSVVIGAGVVIEDDAIIFQQVTLGARDIGVSEYPTIRRGARIFAGSVVVGAVEVGEGAVVGANSLVLEDVPAWTVVAGTPARVVGTRVPRDLSLP